MTSNRRRLITVGSRNVVCINIHHIINSVWCICYVTHILIKVFHVYSLDRSNRKVEQSGFVRVTLLSTNRSNPYSF